MAPEELDRKIETYIDIIKERFNLELVVLFGSRARGKAGKHSDIDLAVFVEEKPDSKYLEEESLLYKCRRNIDLKIEPHLFYFKDYLDHEPADFISEVLRTGKVLYKKSA